MSTIMSSREFNQDTGKAKRAAVEGPVFITDRGKPSLVLMSIEEYERISGIQPHISELLAMDDSEIEFLPPKLDIKINPTDFN